MPQGQQSYGPRVTYHLQYAALIDNPEATIRSLLDFVSEPYSAKCLEPLAQRINSSNLPTDFKSGDPATDPEVVEAARQLSAEIEETPQASEHSPSAADELEAEFRERVRYVANLDHAYQQARQITATMSDSERPLFRRLSERPILRVLVALFYRTYCN